MLFTAYDLNGGNGLLLLSFLLCTHYSISKGIMLIIILLFTFGIQIAHFQGFLFFLNCNLLITCLMECVITYFKLGNCFHFKERNLF